MTTNTGRDLLGGVNAPVIQGNAEHVQMIGGIYDSTVHQTQSGYSPPSPGFEAIARAVERAVQGLPHLGLTRDERGVAEAVANEVLDEVSQEVPDRGKIRRALSALKGIVAPAAVGLAAGSTQGAQEWALETMRQLSNV